MPEDPMTKPRDTSLRSENVPPRGQAKKRDGAAGGTDDEPKLREPSEKEQKPGGAVRQDSGVLGDVSPRDETTR